MKLEDIVPATQGMAQRRSALFATETSKYQKPGIPIHDRNCFECGLPGHLSASCPELIGGRRGRGQVWRGRGRAHLPQGYGGGGRGQGTRQDGRANVSAVDDVSQIIKVEMTATELEEWHEFKGMKKGDKEPNQAATASAKIYGNTSSSTKYNCNDAPWLIDSGASRHMAGSYKDFTKYFSRLKRETVKLADGSIQHVMGFGTIVCSPNISLSSVLHVPSFLVNILSISCITNELNCVALFFPSWCLFRELGLEEGLGRGGCMMACTILIRIFHPQ